MKKLCVFLLSVLMVCVLCACTDTGGIYTVEKNGNTFEVDRINGTIFDGTYTYQYNFMGDADDYSFDVTYPDGVTYYWDYAGGVGQGGWSDDYDDALYVDGAVLCEVVAENALPPIGSWKIIVPALLIIIGVLNAVVPQTAWRLEYGWRYKNAEPSDTALVLNRIGGIIAIVIGGVILVL